MKKTATLKLLLLAFLCLNPTVEIQAQTITLGSGTDINGITTSSPINIWYRRTVCQMVYTAAELTAEGAVAGPISELGFFITNNPVHNLPGYEIQMKHTTDTDASGSLEGGYTTVKSIGSYAPISGGWDMHDLDTPFDWDGVQNIVVRICWSQVTPTYDPSGQLRVYTATNGYKYRRDDAAGSACGLVPNVTLNTKPQIRFVFQSETEWTGAVNTDWFNAGNWTAAVPDETMDVVIPAGVPNDPVLNVVGACKNITLSGTMTLGSLAELQVYGNFTNTGTYTDLGGITHFTGTSAHTITTTPEMTIMNLRTNSSAGTTVSGTVRVGTELQVNKGELNTGDGLIIQSNATRTARIDELSTTCTYTINMTDSWGDGWNGGFITVFEEGEEIGTFSCVGAASSATFQIVSGASFTVNYTSGSYEGENEYDILDEGGATLFSDGPFPATGDAYTDVASGCSFSSAILGDITMERYIDAGETFWRYFASAVEDPTIAQYLDDFTTAGFPGSPFPDFPFTSIYSYDETLGPGAGYVPCSGTDEVIEVAQGYQVWSGDTITGTDPFLVDLVGPANQGDITFPVTYTPSGTPAEDGWCLVGNPYASTIDWDSPNWTKTNMADATYIQDPDTQNYATYIAGAGANGGTRYIASQQSFWVSATGAAPELTATEGVKSSVDATFFKSGEIYNPGMTIQLNGGVVTDEAVLRHIDGASDSFESHVDAVKVFGGWGVNPQLTLMNGEEKDLTVHSIDKGFEEWEIPLRTIVFTSGLYELKFINPTELDVPCLKLEDTYTGEFYDIDPEDETALEFFLSDTTYAPRFIIHLGRDYDRIRVNASCFGASNGEFEIDLDMEEVVSYELLSADGLDYGEGTGDPLVLEGLSQGLYALTIDDFGDLCETSLFHFTINEPTPITVESEITDETFGGDGSILVESDGGVLPYTYEWSTGETTNAIFELFSGTYELVITDGNGCELEESFFVNSSLEIDEVEVEEDVSFNYELGSNRIIVTGPSLKDESLIYLFDIKGDLIAEYKLDQGMTTQELIVSATLAKGVYFLKPESNSWTYQFVR